jgi:hypothetical protein
MTKNVTTDLVLDLGRKAVKLADRLTWKKTGERWLHGVVLGLFEAKLGRMQSEYPVETFGAVTKPKCIDLRYGGGNPAVIELVVRVNGNELYGSQNKSELWKLCKIPFSKARRRILLLLDPSHLGQIEKSSMKSTYDEIRTGRGRFTRETVTVVYVNPDEEYSFKWRPL